MSKSTVEDSYEAYPSSSLYVSDVITADTIRKVTMDVIGELPDIYCILFGSYARGCADKSSDIDLLLFYDREKRDCHFMKNISEDMQSSFSNIDKFCKPIYSTIDNINSDNSILFRQYIKYGIVLQGLDIHKKVENESVRELRILEYEQYWTPAWQRKMETLEYFEKEGMNIDSKISWQYLFLLLYWYAKAQLTLQNMQYSLNRFTLSYIYEVMLHTRLNAEELEVLEFVQMKRDCFESACDYAGNECFTEYFAIAKDILDKAESGKGIIKKSYA